MPKSKNKSASEENTENADAIWQDVRQAFRSNLSRILTVINEDEDGPRRMTQAELSERTGIAKSTVAKFLSDKDDSTINPDLKTLCRIAAALNVSPSMLLMSNDDWSRLVGSISGLIAHLHQSSDVTEFASIRRRNTTENVKRAIAVAERHGLLHQAPQPLAGAMADAEPGSRWARDTENLRRRQLQGIKAASALPAWGAIPSDAESLFILCALLGASTNL